MMARALLTRPPKLVRAAHHEGATMGLEGKLLLLIAVLVWPLFTLFSALHQ